MIHQQIETTLDFALAYITYVKEKNPKLHKEANGSPPIDNYIEKVKQEYDN